MKSIDKAEIPFKANGIFFVKNQTNLYTNYFISVIIGQILWKGCDFVSKWDIVVITASDKNQETLYSHKIRWGIDTGLLPRETVYKIITDDSGKRIGSGGATLSVINKLSREFNLYDKKILLIHSGGDSKRIPQYSASGKLFSPVLKYTQSDTPSTLFDELFKSVSIIPSVCKSGILVMSGDVLVTFDGADETAFSGDIVALSTKAPAEEGCHHGVFCCENNIVTRFLHKSDIDNLERMNAVKNGTVDIDTGAIFLNSNVVESLASLVDKQEKYDEFVNENVRLNFYGDFLFPAARESTLNEYLNEPCEFESVSEELKNCREVLWDLLSGFKMTVCHLKNGRFVHFGTTAQFLQIVNENKLGWEKSVLCNRSDIHAYNSYASPDAVIKGYIENSLIKENVTIGENSIVSGAYLENATVPDNTVVSIFALEGDKFCLRVYPVDCNPKNDNMWEKRIFPVFDDYKECGKYLEHFLKNDEEYESCEKMSFKESFEQSRIFLNSDKEIQSLLKQI